jgi:hypothetical protein
MHQVFKYVNYSCNMHTCTINTKLQQTLRFKATVIFIHSWPLVRFEVPTVVIMKTKAFWNATPCQKVKSYWHFKILKDKNSICQTHNLLYEGYMIRPFIGSSSGLLWSQVSEFCVHVGIPTMLTNSRNITYLTTEVHKIDVIV